MVYNNRSYDTDETMPQTVPSAGYTPPCDYSNFADNFDLSLLPGGDLPLSPSTLFYTQSPPHVSCGEKPKIFTTFYPNSPDTNLDNNDIELGPDFQKLLVPEKKESHSLFPHSPVGGIFLEVPTAKNFHPNSPKGALSPYSSFSSNGSDCIGIYPTSPADSHSYLNSPNSIYSRSPSDSFASQQYIKEEPYSPYPQSTEDLYLSPCRQSAPASPCTNANNNNTNSDNYNFLDILGETLLDKSKIKQETSTVDFREILDNFQSTDTLRELLEDSYKPQIVPEVKPPVQDYTLLREVLKDTSFQEKYNIKLINLELPNEFNINQTIKMEETDEPSQSDSGLMTSCAREKIEPMLSLAIEQMRKDINNICSTLNISPDPSQWSSTQVFSWIELTGRQFGLPPSIPENWDLPGSNLVTLSEEDFARRALQSGSILYAQLEIWKAACLEDEMNIMHWVPESASSNASSGDMSDDDEEETPTTSTATPTPIAKPSTSRGGSHIHLWQFLKELLASPHLHGSCIRWLDRSKGVFKIEDSVRVAKLWGKRKNRPAMNYDKLSRSIRQYYKKGIMKKTERSQRLVYQFCHPYCL